MRERQGFTLIELLVVIAIIGLLATMAVVSFSGARVKARDAKRISDMKQIYNAIELYYDEYGHYPIPVTTWSSFDAPNYMNVDMTNPAATDLTAALQPWLGTNIGDPKSLGTDSGYLYRQANSGRDFCILIYKTPENMNNFPTSMVVFSRCGTIGGDGQCSGRNNIYMGSSAFPNGC